MRYFDPIPWDDVHFQRQQELVARVQRLYDKAMREAVRLGVATNIRDFQKQFRFKDYPQLEKAINELIAQLQGSIVKTMEDAQTKSWEWANAKNDAFLAHVLGRRVSDMPLRYFARNMAALGAFQQRKEAGLNLSDRVWKYSRQFKEEIEQALDVGLDGRPAASVARDIKKYLNEPDKRFRRIRDKHGTLKLSKNALSYHPGAGVYRSSYKNAERLARTEINMAYRTADHLRFQEFDFIVGFEVKRSGRGGACPVCDKLKGKYPKTFVFRSWHSNCRCYVVSILSTEAEFESNLATGSTKSENEVKKPHAGWYEYLSVNKDKIEKALNKPYFIGDNPGFVKYGKVVKKSEPVDRIATALKIKKGLPMSFEQANELKGNINYKSSHEYSINCQSCVVAHELRLRGYNVTANGNTKRPDNIPYQLSKYTENAWVDKDGKTPKSNIIGFGSKSITKTNKEFFEQITEPGRYNVKWAWKKGGGHIISFEKLSDGAFRFYDPQTGKIIDWAVYSKFIKPSWGLRVLRVDVLEPNLSIIDKVVGPLN